ncbi:MAG: FAD-linked oxidase C-terminal domain-containing protein [Gammaproteobacteria bacterium]
MITSQPHASEKIRHSVDKQTLLNALREFLPESSLLSGREATAPFECDALSVYRCLPWIVVLPENAAQTQMVLRVCSRFGVPVVARGAGTGLAGGALPLDNGVLLGLSKLNRILHIDSQNRTARVQPGVRNLAISHAAAAYGLYYAPDPSSQLACSIGGNVAENSGGVHCLKYGLTTHNILQVSLLTMDGERFEIGASSLDVPGYDLLAAVTGSEGMLGIAVEITVKLLPMPEKAQVLLAAFASIAQAGAAVAGIIAAGLIPAGLEMMDKASIAAAEAFVHAGYPKQAEAILLCEMDGSGVQVADDIARAAELLRGFGALQVDIAQSEAQRQKMWAGRKAAFAALGRITPDYYCMDGTIPRRHLARVLQQIAVLAEKYGLKVANVFHAGDGNLHPLILYNAEIPGELRKAEQFGGEILELCIAAGGTITGEHGVGMEKINHMCLQFGTAELRQFHALKRAFDPQGLLNPGKAIPTLHRCAEFGAMHVHRGRLAHAELERF